MFFFNESGGRPFRLFYVGRRSRELRGRLFTADRVQQFREVGYGLSRLTFRDRIVWFLFRVQQLGDVRFLAFLIVGGWCLGDVLPRKCSAVR